MSGRTYTISIPLRDSSTRRGQAKRHQTQVGIHAASIARPRSYIMASEITRFVEILIRQNYINGIVQRGSGPTGSELNQVRTMQWLLVIALMGSFCPGLVDP